MERRGIEPRFAECDSAVIPLDHRPGKAKLNLIRDPLNVKMQDFHRACAFDACERIAFPSRLAPSAVSRYIRTQLSSGVG